MKKTLCLLLLLAFFNVYSQDKDTTRRIDETFLNIIVKIDIPSPINKTGTGFIVGRRVGTGDEFKVFLVTNKHMIGHYSYVDPFIPFDSIIVNFYKEDGAIFKGSILIKGNKNGLNPLVSVHPQNDIDVIAINITNIYNQNAKLVKAWAETSFLIPLDSITSFTELGLGSQVFALGYPAGIASAKTNKPIAKAGYISSIVNSKFQIDIPVKDRNKKVYIVRPNAKIFLVDGLIIGGNSGGPVINPQEPKIRVKNGMLEHTNTMPNFIIGIVSSGFENTGLSIIYSCDHILELIAK